MSNQHECAISLHIRLKHLKTLILIAYVPFLEQDNWSVVKKMNN